MSYTLTMVMKTCKEGRLHFCQPVPVERQPMTLLDLT